MRDNKYGEIDFPLRSIPDHELRDFLMPLKENLGDTVTLDELERGAELAKSVLAPSLKSRPCSYISSGALSRPWGNLSAH